MKLTKTFHQLCRATGKFKKVVQKITAEDLMGPKRGGRKKAGSALNVIIYSGL